MIRRTPLRRGASLQATSALSRTSRLKPRSAKRVTRNEENDAVVRAVVFARDGGRCVAKPVADKLGGKCFGPLTPHHLIKASKGGAYSPEVLVSLCSFHNGMVEDRPATAHSLGLVVRSGETLEEAYEKMRAAGMRPPK